MAVDLILSISRRIGEGQFADVFETTSGIACKVFRSAGTDQWRKWAPKIHEAEVDAYIRAHEHHELSQHMPTFYGSTHVSAVFDAELDRSSAYLLDTGLLLERVYGSETKATYLSENKYPHVYRLAALFRKVGVDVGDASVMNYEDPAKIMFLDITTLYGARILSEIAI